MSKLETKMVFKSLCVPNWSDFCIKLTIGISISHEYSFTRLKTKQNGNIQRVMEHTSAKIYLFSFYLKKYSYLFGEIDTSQSIYLYYISDFYPFVWSVHTPFVFRPVRNSDHTLGVKIPKQRKKDVFHHLKSVQT